MTRSAVGARRAVACTLLFGAFAQACGGGGTSEPDPPEAPVPAALVVVAGSGQSGLRLVPFRDSAVVRVLDQHGQPVPGVTVRWETRADDDAVSPDRAVTAGDGTARALWTPAHAGRDTLRAVLGTLEAVFVAEAGEAGAGAEYEGRKGYIAYVAGDLPVILSAGHGGTLEPAEVPDRTEGTLVRDAETDRLAAAMADSLEARLGGRPHLVISHLHRVKLDPNRALPEATGGNPRAEHAWREYHGLLEHARSRVEADHGAGLYLDVHGHGHDIPRLELGYLLSAADLALADAQLDAAPHPASSSLRALAEASALPFSDLVRGPSSLGALFAEAGVPAVPAPDQPAPGADPYFTGGYATARHGSRDGGAVSGAQIEAHRVGIRDTEENRARFAGIAATVIQTYLATHYGFAAVETSTTSGRWSDAVVSPTNAAVQPRSRSSR